VTPGVGRETGLGGGRRPPPRRPPIALAVAVTTGWAALVSFAPVLGLLLAGFAIGGNGPSGGESFQLSLAGWLLAHGVALETRLGPIGLAPLTLTGFAFWRLIRAGVHTARAIRARRGRPWVGTLVVGGSVGLAYAVLGAITALAVQVPGLSVSVLRAAVTFAVFGLVAGLIGAFTETGLLAQIVPQVPAPVRDGLRTGLIAALLILAAGAASAGMAVALSGGEVAQMLVDYDTGLSGQIGLTVLCLLYSPTITIWAASYLVGPGFMVGADTIVSVARVSLGTLPAAPALAGLPSGAASAWASVLLGLPLAAGMTAGWRLERLRGGRRPGSTERPVPGVSWPALLTSAALAGPVAGAVLALACLAASGPLGGGRLATIGPAAMPVGLVAAGVVTAGALAAAAGTRLVAGARPASGEPMAEFVSRLRKWRTSSGPRSRKR